MNLPNNYVPRTMLNQGLAGNPDPGPAAVLGGEGKETGSSHPGW